ncbi:MAG: hypothetical protein ACI865_001660 [Flavobacteriaceae bacterium]|jgi:hypothetical protein
MSGVVSIWKSIESILVVIPFDQVDKVNEWREAMKNVGLNVHNCRVLCIVPSKEERLSMREMSYINFITDADINLLGQIKNEEAKKILTSSFDAVLIVSDCSKKILKVVNKMKFRIDIGLNTKIENRMINLRSAEIAPKHLLDFVKQTLEKIS